MKTEIQMPEPTFANTGFQDGMYLNGEYIQDFVIEQVIETCEHRGEIIPIAVKPFGEDPDAVFWYMGVHEEFLPNEHWRGGKGQKAWFIRRMWSADPR